MAMYDEWISDWAKREPDRVAVILPSGAIGFAEFDQHINKVARRLLSMGLAPGRIVAVYVADEYVHQLLLLALDRLGIPSVSPAIAAPDNPVFSVLKPAVILSNAPDVQLPSARTIEIDRRWYDEAISDSDGTRPGRPAGHPVRPDEVLRYLSSTGTTGTPKLMEQTRAQIQRRMENLHMVRGGQRPDHRACSLIGPATAASYDWPLSFWGEGSAVVLNMRFTRSIAESLRQVRPTHLMIPVGTLLNIVRGENAELPPVPGMKVWVVGSALPRSLAQEALRVLSSDVEVCYASTETSTITLGSVAVQQRHEGAVGYVQPPAELQVVDTEDRPLPPGTSGILRVRTSGMITRYLNPDRSERALDGAGLRDGWFYPGDLGSIEADGLVVVEGRVNDVMNIGGTKYLPLALEEEVLACTGIRDAAAFSVADPATGVEVPWIAVVRGDDYRQGEVIARLQQRWPTLGGIRVAVTREVPRNHLGKIDRRQLRQQGREWMVKAAQ